MRWWSWQHSKISDIANSPIADVVLENCPTKILLPNAGVEESWLREFYARVGLNERELENSPGQLFQRALLCGQ